jgi:hypothetical protein
MMPQVHPRRKLPANPAAALLVLALVRVLERRARREREEQMEGEFER